MPNTICILAKTKKKWSITLLLLLSLLWFSPSVGAEEGALNFYVTPEFPESQVEGTKNYFDLQGQPGSTHTLRLKLQNIREEEAIIQITPHTAFTNVLGVVEYGKNADEADSSLKYGMDTLIETPEPIILAGKETKTIALELHMPAESFEGFLAGGLRIEEVTPEEEQTPIEQEGVAIQNEFVYVVAVLASNDRSSVQPDLALLDVFADQLNYRNVISANLQNFMPTFVNQLAVEATVHKVGEEEPLYEAQQEQMQMAPNSNFNFPISLEGDRFQSGEYLLKLRATAGKEEWSWEETFIIEADEAQALNRADVTIDTSINWWMIGGIIVILLLLVLTVWLYLKQKRTNHKTV